jgi:hypothetical protein
MNNKSLVRLSNIIGITSIILLVYWVFVFISIQIFGFKVFRENLTESFYMSVLGILALMFGALIINVMFNLTRIAEKHNQDNSVLLNNNSKKLSLLFGLSFPLIFGLLFGGDYLSSIKKEKMLIASAKSIIDNDPNKIGKLLNYEFTQKWIIETENTLDLYSKTDENFPNVEVIVLDSIDNSKVFLGFPPQYINQSDTIPPIKKDYLLATTKEEREYLNKVFEKDFKQVKFSANKGNYELFYPYMKNKKKIVLHFADFQRYGKLGS